eukprot:tig00000478_g1257.t1
MGPPTRRQRSASVPNLGITLPANQTTIEVERDAVLFPLGEEVVDRRRSALQQSSRPDNERAQLNLLKRESIKNDATVLKLISQLFAAADADRDGRLRKEEYKEAHLAIYRALHVDWDREAAERCAESDWLVDRRGLAFVDKLRWRVMMFNLCDEWTETITAEEYRAFLAALLSTVAGPAHAARRPALRKLDAIPPGVCLRPGVRDRRSSRDGDEAAAAAASGPAGGRGPAVEEVRGRGAGGAAAPARGISEAAYRRLLGSWDWPAPLPPPAPPRAPLTDGGRQGQPPEDGRR